MQTLEGEEAKNYLDRLSKTLAIDERVSFSDHSLEPLLQAMVAIELALFRSLTPNPDEPLTLTVTSTGFPIIPVTLAHVDTALRLNREKVSQRKKLAASFIESLNSFEASKISASAKTLSQSSNQLEPIAISLSSLTSEQISYLQTLNISTKGARLPFFTLDTFPGLLVSQVADTPFSHLQEKEKKRTSTINNYLFFRKFIDSPSFDRYAFAGTPENPLMEKSHYTPPPRPPVVISGRIDKKTPDKIEDYYNIRQSLMTGWIGYEKTAPNADGLPEEKTITVKTAELHHPTLGKITTILNSKDFRHPFLNIDYANLSDNAVDIIIGFLPKIQADLEIVASEVEKVAKNLPPDIARNQQASLEITAILESIDDAGARTAIQLAIGRMVNRTKSVLNLPDPSLL